MALVGKTFPDMSVKAIDEMGDAFQINVLKQAVDNKKKVCLFWYPKDFTFVCPTEIHAFQEAMCRALGLAVLTAFLALPVGLGLAWVLLAIVNVAAFGWRLPMEVFPWDWAKLLLWALVGAALAAAVPMRRLAKLPPSELLKVFAHER